jgi:hypothetical protein
VEPRLERVGREAAGTDNLHHGCVWVDAVRVEGGEDIHQVPRLHPGIVPEGGRLPVAENFYIS